MIERRARFPGRIEVSQGDVERLYVVIPYLKTSQPVTLRKIKLFPSHSLEELNEDISRHLHELCSMFYLRDELRIREMTCGVVDVPTLMADGVNVNQRLWEVHTLLAYFHGSPGPRPGDPWLRLEHSTVFRFLPKLVSRFLIWPEHGVDGHIPKKDGGDSTNWDVEGYDGWTDAQSYIYVVPGSRIYPPTLRMWLNVFQDLYANLASTDRRYASSVLKMLRGDQFVCPALEKRVLLAMDWYNRSTSMDTTDQRTLIDLAVAFETLLGLEEDAGKEEGLRQGIATLLGPIPRLNSWVTQFYKARSGIVHTGEWTHLGFYATDKKAVKEVLNGKGYAVRYRSLNDYGRLLFRLCVETMLTGGELSQYSGLEAVFYHNQERLERICNYLRSADLPAIDLLSRVGQEVRNLHEYWLESEDIVRLDTLFGVGKLLSEKCLQALGLDIPETARSLIQGIVDKHGKGTKQSMIRRYETLAHELKQLKTFSTVVESGSGPSNWLEVVWSFAEYASSPGFNLKAFFEDEGKASLEKEK